MEAAAVFGIIGSVATIGDVLTKTISRLSTLRTKYKNADLSISTLLGQLCTVKAALEQLQGYDSRRWNARMNHIQPTLEGCEALIRGIDQRLDTLERNDVGILKRSGKAKLLWQESDLLYFLGMLDRQINALNLFLQVFQCTSEVDEDALLHEEDSTTILRLSREATESVVAIDDTASRLSRASLCTVDTAKLGECFDFDSLLLGSKVYRTPIEQNTRDLIHAKQHTIRQSPPVPMKGNAQHVLDEEDTASPSARHTGNTIAHLRRVESSSNSVSTLVQHHFPIFLSEDSTQSYPTVETLPGELAVIPLSLTCHEDGLALVRLTRLGAACPLLTPQVTMGAFPEEVLAALLPFWEPVLAACKSQMSRFLVLWFHTTQLRSRTQHLDLCVDLCVQWASHKPGGGEQSIRPLSFRVEAVGQYHTRVNYLYVERKTARPDQYKRCAHTFTVPIRIYRDVASKDYDKRTLGWTRDLDMFANDQALVICLLSDHWFEPSPHEASDPAAEAELDAIAVSILTRLVEVRKRMTAPIMIFRAQGGRPRML